MGAFYGVVNCCGAQECLKNRAVFRTVPNAGLGYIYAFPAIRYVARRQIVKAQVIFLEGLVANNAFFRLRSLQVMACCKIAMQII